MRTGFSFHGTTIEAFLENFVMPKDIHGKYHPPKGKPSDTRKEETNKELKDELAGDEHLTHQNRNRNKKRDKEIPRDEQQQDEPKHGRTGKVLKSETGEVIGESPRPLTGVIGRKGSEPETGQEGLTQQMSTIDAKDLRSTFVELAKYPADVCVSMYLGGPGWEDGLPLKNALRDARRQMEKMGIIGVIDKILAPAVWLVNDAAFWRREPKGLALFLAPEYHALMELPYDPGNEVHVHTSFILAPLTPMVSGEDEYFVLTLSKHRAQLYRGSGYYLQRMKMPEMPLGVADVGQVQQERGVGGEEEKKNLEAYFQEVDRTLHGAGLATERIPLLLAGVDYELRLFRDVTKYSNVMTAELHGNFDRVPLTELTTVAHEKMQDYFEVQWREKVQQHLDKGTAPVTHFPQDVIRAAFEGRVAQLFLAKGVLLWGKYASAPVEPVIHREEEPGDDCLTNQLVVQTILHGGQAFVEDREKMPGEGEMVAVLRYS